MSTVFLATLGVRPEAITIALDALLEKYTYDAIGILHTAPKGSLAIAYRNIQHVLTKDYAHISKIQMHHLRRANGKELGDIDNRDAAHDYLMATLAVLREYQKAGYRMHFMVSGGRKAMSIYATIAAMWLFVPFHDKLFTVLTPDLFMREGVYHLPVGSKDRTILVDLPLLDLRVDDNMPLDMLLSSTRSRREDFLAKLTPEERKLCEALSAHPYFSNQQLAEFMRKSLRTIENQLTSVYEKLTIYLHGGEHVNNKRQALLQLLNR